MPGPLEPAATREDGAESPPSEKPLKTTMLQPSYVRALEPGSAAQTGVLVVASIDGQSAPAPSCWLPRWADGRQRPSTFFLSTGTGFGITGFGR